MHTSFETAAIARPEPLENGRGKTPILTMDGCEPLATMTPVVLLVVFCTAMGLIALGRLALDANRDPVDVGTTLVVWGITALTAVWTSLEEGWLAAGQLGVLGGLGFLLVATGVAAIAYYWRDPQRKPGNRHHDDVPDDVETSRE